MLIGARLGSPLVVGYGEGETYLGSDALALAPLTQQIAYLDEGDWVVITRDGAQVYDAENRPVTREITTSGASAAAVEKGAYRHYMQKEIFEQPTVVAQTLRSYIHQADNTVALPQIDFDLSGIRRITIVACGTSFYAGMVAKYWFETFARVPVDIDFASEFRYREPVLENGGLSLFISQSGETADTLAALRYCKQAGQTIAVVVNVPTSSMAREADLLLPTHAGPEIGVASTKAFTCQLAVLAALAAHLAVKKGQMDRAEEEEVVRHLLEAPAALGNYSFAEHMTARGFVVVAVDHVGVVHAATEHEVLPVTVGQVRRHLQEVIFGLVRVLIRQRGAPAEPAFFVDRMRVFALRRLIFPNTDGVPGHHAARADCVEKDGAVVVVTPDRRIRHGEVQKLAGFDFHVLTDSQRVLGAVERDLRLDGVGVLVLHAVADAVVIDVVGAGALGLEARRVVAVILRHAAASRKPGAKLGQLVELPLANP
jgi:D-arabinose 5-phosphate isomerase GutQ